MAKINWKDVPEEHDYQAAANYLSLLTSDDVIERLIAQLRSAPIMRGEAKDILRSSRLMLLPADDQHVAKDLAKARDKKPLSPILLVRGDIAHGVALQVADGYHRVCASYHLGEDSDIPYRIAMLDSK